MHNLRQLQQWLLSNHHRHDVQLLRNVQIVIELGNVTQPQLQAEFDKSPSDTSSLIYHVNKQAKTT